MPTPVRFKAAFCFARHVRLVFQSIDGLMLFRTNQHRILFLRKCHLYLSPFMIFRAYSLLPNQVHLVVSIKEKEGIVDGINWIPYVERTRSMANFLKEPTERMLNQMLERQVNRLLVSYVNSYNYLEERKGGLFQKPFKRIALSGIEELKESILFVHTCAQRNRCVQDYRIHPYHSLMEPFAETTFLVNPDDVLECFETREEYRLAHTRYAEQLPDL